MAMKRHLPIMILPLIFGLLISNLPWRTVLGKLECEDLPIEDCAYSVASSGTRCVLEINYRSGKANSVQYECQSSAITAEKQEEWIESDECVNACGLERMSVGLSTDLLLDNHFTERFCSSECLNNCPNIIDLYMSLAAGEGMYLPQLCEAAHRTRRVIPNPVKKAMDAEYYLQPMLSAMAPDGSRLPPDLVPRSGPGYGGYEGISGDVITPSGGGEFNNTPHAPLQIESAMAPSPPPLSSASTDDRTYKRPFFFTSESPPSDTC